MLEASDRKPTTASSQRKTRGLRGGVGAQQQIQELIISGVFAEGDRLVEEDLATRLAVSRTPIREALHALAAQGLVTRSARTWTVRKLGVRDLREIYEIRAALECAAARLAAIRRSPEQMRAIDIANRAGRSLLDEPASDVTPDGHQLHSLIVEAANNQRLADEVERTRLIYFSRPVTAMPAEEIKESIAEHESIAQAIRDQNAHAAEAAMRDHIEHALDHVIRRLVWLS